MKKTKEELKKRLKEIGYNNVDKVLELVILGLRISNSINKNDRKKL